LKRFGLIYAGGSGTRLGGVDKGAIVLGGESLLERVHRHLRGCDPILVAIGPREPTGPLELADHLDDPPGPVAALFAFWRWWQAAGSSEACLITTAVDTPGVPPTFAEAMEKGAATFGACHAVDGGGAHWTHAGILVSRLGRALANRPNSPKALLQQILSRPVEFPEADREAFRSINTPVDLAFWRARLSSGQGSGKSGLGKPDGVR
jgi:molybdopterin-guanine dinucleotide biosynthesis protein A